MESKWKLRKYSLLFKTDRKESKRGDRVKGRVFIMGRLGNICRDGDKG